MARPACLAAARRHPVAAAAAILAAGGAVAVDAAAGKPGKGAAYVGTMLIAALAADLLASRTRPPEPPPVRRPAREATVALVATAVGAAAIFLRFAGPTAGAGGPGILRLVLVAATLLFTLPVALAGWLLLQGYRPGTLGVRLRGLDAGAAALLLTLGAALLVDPGKVTLWPALEETGGWPGLLVLGFLGAALPEEFLRFVLQTRLGAVLRNPATGWLLASAAWAVLHVPSFSRQAEGDLLAGALGALRILPLGLLWGYLTHRTGSLVPALLAHGLNLWGLQNS